MSVCLILLHIKSLKICTVRLGILMDRDISALVNVHIDVKLQIYTRYTTSVWAHVLPRFLLLRIGPYHWRELFSTRHFPLDWWVSVRNIPLVAYVTRMCFTDIITCSNVTLVLYNKACFGVSLRNSALTHVYYFS